MFCNNLNLKMILYQKRIIFFDFDLMLKSLNLCKTNKQHYGRIRSRKINEENY